VGFEIPNVLDGVDLNQSELDARDIEIILAGFLGTGVLSGCAVTERNAGAGGPNLSVDVAAGRVQVAGAEVAVAAANKVIAAADLTNPRFDLVVASSAGVLSVVTGVPADIDGEPGPVYPAIPANSVVLAAVWVPAGDNAITTAQARDKRVMLGRRPAVMAKVYRSTAKSIPTGTDTAIDYDSTDYDPYGLHDPAVNPTRLTVPVGSGLAGKWLFMGLNAFASNATGYRTGNNVKNAVTNLGHMRLNAVNGQFTILETYAVADMAEGDYMENTVHQNSGGALNSSSGLVGSWYVAIFLGKGV
jgi:hypothetical protein